MTTPRLDPNTRHADLPTWLLVWLILLAPAIAAADGDPRVGVGPPAADGAAAYDTPFHRGPLRGRPAAGPDVVGAAAADPGVVDAHAPPTAPTGARAAGLAALLLSVVAIGALVRVARRRRHL